MDLCVVCLLVFQCGDEKIYLARLQRGSATIEIRVSEEGANQLNLIFGVPFCED